MLSSPRLGSPPLALGGFIEDRQALGRRERPVRIAPDDPDGVALDDPLDVVARPNPKPIGDRLRYRDLELAGDLGHVLTLTRILALINHGIVPLFPSASLTTGLRPDVSC